MRPADDIEKKVGRMSFAAGEEMRKRMLDEVLATHDKCKQEKLDPKGTSVWRIIMKNRMTRLAVAAVIIVAALIAVNQYTGSIDGTSVAYALGQTIEACSGVKTIHLMHYKGVDSQKTEFWIEYGQEGRIVNMRMFVEQSPEGPRTVIWRAGKAKVWMPAKNVLLTIVEERAIREFEHIIEGIDPKRFMENIRDAQETGMGEVKITAPSKEGDSIKVVLTNQAEKKRFVAQVDAETKLLTEIKIQRIKGESFDLEDRFEIIQYDQPFSEDLFAFKDLPKEIRVIDKTDPQVGLPQGDMTDEQIAAKLVREFYTAYLIDYDFEKADRLAGGMPFEAFGSTASLEKRKALKVTIIAVGKPVPHEQTRGLQVPVTLRFQASREEVIEKTPIVRQIKGRPRRWEVIGGF